VRLDSGDLAEHAREVRQILDEGGLEETTIFSSGDLDEYRLRALLQAEAPIDGFGIGTRLDISVDAPSMDCVYKLQEYAGKPRRKRSEHKANWPGCKQVYRRWLADGTLAGDCLGLEAHPQPGTALLEPVMQNGRRLAPRESLSTIRQRAGSQLASLPPALRANGTAPPYPVDIAPELRALAIRLDQDIH
jgi:nicotinate phosphoribosyltransferase